MRKKLILLQILMLLISPFLSVQPAAAQSPPAPTPDGGDFYFKGDENTILFDGTINGVKVNLDLNRVMSYNFTTDSIRAAHNQVSIDYSQFTDTGYRAYRLSSGTGYNSLNYTFFDDGVPSGKKGDDASYLSANGPFVIFAGIPNGSKFLWKNIGMYWYATASGILGTGHDVVVSKDTTGAYLSRLCEYNINWVVNNRTDPASKIREELRSFNNLLPTDADYVLTTMMGSDLASNCVQSKLLWNTLKQMVRDFFIPAPDAEHASVNANWSNNRDSWIERMKSGETIRNHFINLLEYFGLPKTYLDSAAGTAQFGLTSTGEANATNIQKKADELKTIIATIKSSTDAPLEGAPADGSWICGNTAKIAEFKWDSALTAKPITTLTQFSEAVDKLFEDFQDFKTSMGSTPGEDSQCKQTGTGFIAMVNEGFCAMLVVVKGWADGFFKTAVCWLKASLGVSDSGQTTPTDTSCPTSSSGGGGGGTVELPPNKLTFASGSIGFDATAVIADIKTAATGTSTITGDIYPMSGGSRVESKKNVAAIKFIGEIKEPTAQIEIYSQALMDDAWCQTYTNFVFIFPAGSNSYKVMFNKTGTNTFAITGKITRTTAVTAGTAEEQAKALCNIKKPPTTLQTDWDKGPCLSPNINNTGYAVDIAQNPRTTAGDANTCTGSTKYVVLDSICGTVKIQN